MYVRSNEIKNLAVKMPDRRDFLDLDIIHSPLTTLPYEYDGAMLSNMGGTEQIKLGIGRMCH